MRMRTRVLKHPHNSLQLQVYDKNGAGSFLEYLLHFLSARRNVVLPVRIPKFFVKTIKQIIIKILYLSKEIFKFVKIGGAKCLM
jgi:hypothetical protein